MKDVEPPCLPVGRRGVIQVTWVCDTANIRIVTNVFYSPFAGLIPLLGCPRESSFHEGSEYIVSGLSAADDAVSGWIVRDSRFFPDVSNLMHHLPSGLSQAE